jgi:uncharacterized protein (TIGR02284 family)
MRVRDAKAGSLSPTRGIAMLDRHVISALNELIETSRDGQKGFAFAAKASRDPIMIRMFMEAERSRRDATVELQDSVRLLGGHACDSGSLRAAAHRGWLRLKNALSARDDRAILEEREKAEDYTKMRYSEALELNLPEGARALLERQYQIVAANRDGLRELRERS